MARSHIAVALGGAAFTLLLIFQLISSFGFPEITFLNIDWTETLVGSSPYQIPISEDEWVHVAKPNEDLYLLGVGKADITGYTGVFGLLSYMG